MKIYIDNNFKCHTTDSLSFRAVETDAFDNKCTRYIEGYRYIPAGDSWIRSDGRVFTGEMIAPAEDSRLLEAAQAAYEEAMVETADMQAALDAIYSGEVMV